MAALAASRCHDKSHDDIPLRRTHHRPSCSRGSRLDGAAGEADKQAATGAIRRDSGDGAVPESASAVLSCRAGGNVNRAGLPSQADDI